jgi:type I restriction enzyme S subunit
MKNGWQTKTLGELFDITSSKRVFEADWRTEGVPFYRAREIVKLARHGFVENELFISEEMFDRYSTKFGIPAAGDIMVTGVGTLGICYVVKEDDRFYFKDGNIIWLKKKTEANSRFVEYAFQSDYLRSQIDDSVGATVGTFTIIKAKSTRIPVPPLPEQRRIVGLLDEAFAGIATAKANAEKNLQNARALFDSHLQSTFTGHNQGWLEKRLGDFADFKNGLNFTRQSNGRTVRMVGVGDFQENSLVPIDTLQSVTIDGELADDYFIRRDDILTVRSNGSKELVGRCMLVPKVDEGISYSGFIIRIRFDTREVYAPFLLSFMRSRATRERLTRDGEGANISNINQAKLSELSIPLPSFKQQKDIADQIDELAVETQRLESIYAQKLVALNELRKSLLHEAFGGKL